MSELKILKEIDLFGFHDNTKRIQLSQCEHGESGIKCNLFNNRHDKKLVDLSDCLQANFYGSKADETTIGIECVVEDNAVVIPIILQMTTCPGKLKGVLECVFDNGNIRFYGVNFVIGESPNTDKIESTDEFTILETTIAEAKEMLKFADTKLDKPITDGTSGQVLTLNADGTTKWKTVTGGSGGSGTTDYTDLENKPKINGIELNGNLTTTDLGIKDGKDGQNGKDGENGKDGQDYVLTDEDKQEVANMVEQEIELTGYATEDFVNEKIGDIETALDELHNYAQSLIAGGC